MSVFTKRNAIVREKPWIRWLLPIALLVLSLAVIPFVVSLGLSAALAFFCVYILTLFGVMRAQQLMWHATHANVRADSGGLMLDRRRVIRQASVRGIHVVTRNDRTVVRIDRRWDPIEIVVDSEEEGSAVVEAMCLDARRSVATYWFNDGTRRRAVARFTAMLGGIASLLTLAFEVPWLVTAHSLPLAILLPLVLVVGASVYLALSPSFARVVVGPTVCAFGGETFGTSDLFPTRRLSASTLVTARSRFA